MSARYCSFQIHCYGTGTEVAAAFCLSGTGMHSDSGSEFVSGSNLKWNKKVKKGKKIKKISYENFLGKNAASTSKNGKILYNFFKTVLEPETEPKFFRSRNRNRDKSLRFHNTGHKESSI
jgi:hypothetical protein